MNNDDILYINKKDFILFNKNFFFDSNIVDLYKVNKILNLTYITINKLDNILNEWIKYDLLNRSNLLIKDINIFIPHTIDLLKKTNKTIDVYHNIGLKIYDNIELIIIILPISIFIIFCFQIIICIYFIYNNKEFKD